MSRAASDSRLPGRRKRTPGVWCPELTRSAASIDTYLRRVESARLMREKARAAGTLYRHGIPDGWGGKRKIIAEIRKKSAKQAIEIVDKLIEDKRWEPDNAESRLILANALEVVLAEKNTPEGTATTALYGVKERLAAMKMVWEMVQRKPITETVNTNRAEDFLDQLSKKPE